MYSHYYPNEAHIIYILELFWCSFAQQSKCLSLVFLNLSSFYLHKYFGWENSFGLKGRKSPMPQQQPALFPDESRQTDTLNAIQVKSFTKAHVASTWTVKKNKTERPKEQKRLAERWMWVMFWCVLCLWELAGLFTFTSHVCMSGCICNGNILHISFVGVGEQPLQRITDCLLVPACWLRLPIA